MTVDVDITELSHLPDDVQEDARSFILNSWIRSFRDHRAPGLDPDVYARGQRDLILRLIQEAHVTVVTQPGAPDLFVAYCCRAGTVAHFVYTKLPFRRLGIATRLLGDVTTITHWPAEDPERRRRGQPTGRFIRDWIDREQWIYDPFILMR